MPAGPEDAPAVRLSAAGLHDSRPVLAMLEPSAEGGLALHVHAEDAIGGNILLDELTRGLKGVP